MSAKIVDRSDRIMKALLRVGDITIPELVEQIEASAASIRRDLARLEKRGLIRRTHGGATLVEPLLYEPFRHDTSFQARELRAAEQKRRIALAAADLIQKNQMIGLTAGTTTTQIGRALRHRRDISVVTNAVNIGMELCNQSAIRTMVTGGTLSWAWTFAMAGHATLNYLREINLDKAFISATGFDVDRGVSTLETEEATVALAMLRQARKKILVADSTKFGHVSPAVICPISLINVLVTDSGLPDSACDSLKAKGILVIRA